MRRAAVAISLLLALSWGVARRAALADDAAAADIQAAAGDLRSGDVRRRRAALEILAVSSHADLQGERALVRRLERMATKDSDDGIRAAAVDVLALAAGADAADALVELLRTEREPGVAQAAAQAFRHVPSGSVRRELSELAFDDDAPRAACLAAEALGWLPDEGGAADLRALLASAPHWAVAAGACLGLARVRTPEAVGDLVVRLRHPDAAVRSAARDALVRLCGIDHGIEPRAWEDWWEAERPGWTFPDRPDDSFPTASARDDAAAAAGATSDASGPGNRPTFARFFGIPLSGRRVCLVIDTSQSMWGERRRKAEAELLDAVKGLSSATTFGVILFNEKVWWFGDGPLPARPQQKLDLALYLPEQETKSYTNVYDALERALGLLGVGAQARDPAPGLDEIVVLSDGVPNRGRLKDTERILEAVDALNGGRVRIHTVSLGDEELDLLPALAARNGGTHVRHAVKK